MLFQLIIFGLMPYIIFGLSVALIIFWIFSKVSIKIKIILTVALLLFSLLWWFQAGSQVFG